MILLAGVGAAWLLRSAKQRFLRLALGLLLLAGAGHLAWQAWQANTTYAADRENPYVYAQTSPDLLNLVRKVEALAQVHPQGNQMLVKVIAPDGDYWPLPWYLRNLKQDRLVGPVARRPVRPRHDRLRRAPRRPR